MKQCLKEEAGLQDKLAKLYGEKRYSKPYSLAYHTQLAQKIISFLNLKSPILDNGCGHGFMAKFLTSYETVGFDISREMIVSAKKKYKKVIQGDSQNLPFADFSFQTVINKGILHHLSSPQRGIDEISRILAKDGETIFVEPLFNFINALPRKILRGSKHFSSLHKNFKEKELSKMIESKLKIEKICYFGLCAYLLMGLPDIIDIYRFVPLKRIFTPFLIKFDEFIARIPFINKYFCWCIMIKAKKTY